MRITDITTEVAMNPAAFAQSVEQGQQRGVLVGFEFEVCVPKATLDRGKTADSINTRLIDTLQSEDNFISDKDFDLPGLAKFDSMFRAIKGKTKFPSAVACYEHLQATLLDPALEIFHQMPEADRANIFERMRKDFERMRKDLGLENFEAMKQDQLAFAKLFAETAIDYCENKKSRRELADLAYRMYNVSDVTWKDLLEEMTLEDDPQLSKYFAFDPDEVYQYYDLDSYLNDDWDEYPQYDKTSKLLKPALEQTMGKKVNIFSNYHERAKNRTDWYIEPDGSINVDNDGDGIAEIVGPPEPPQQALQSLKQFYAMAQQLELYTNNSTGCHINVSIPNNIDLLKLTLFLGDTHVLRQFGREFNQYAVSSEKTVAQNVSQHQGKKKQKLIRLPNANKQRSTTEINTDILLQLARDATSAHQASISSNGKYISFRHTGGNYLARFDDVINVVGRFVRAVVIASDPRAYVQQYEAMKYKLAMTNVKPSTASQIQQAQTQGVPGYRLHVQRMTRNTGMEKKATFEKVFKAMDLAKYFELDKIMLNSVEARQALVRANPSREPGPDDAYATVELVGTVGPNQKLPFEINRVSAVRNDNYYKVAVYLAEPITVPARDPKAQKYLLKLRKQAVGAKE